MNMTKQQQTTIYKWSLQSLFVVLCSSLVSTVSMAEEKKLSSLDLKLFGIKASANAYYAPTSGYTPMKRKNLLMESAESCDVAAVSQMASRQSPKYNFYSNGKVNERALKAFAEYLSKRRDLVDLQDSEDETAIYKSLDSMCEPMVQLLLASGASMQAKGANNGTIVLAKKMEEEMSSYPESGAIAALGYLRVTEFEFERSEADAKVEETVAGVDSRGGQCNEFDLTGKVDASINLRARVGATVEQSVYRIRGSVNCNITDKNKLFLEVTYYTTKSKQGDKDPGYRKLTGNFGVVTKDVLAGWAVVTAAGIYQEGDDEKGMDHYNHRSIHVLLQKTFTDVFNSGIDLTPYLGPQYRQWRLGESEVKSDVAKVFGVHASLVTAYPLELFLKFDYWKANNMDERLLTYGVLLPVGKRSEVALEREIEDRKFHGATDPARAYSRHKVIRIRWSINF